MFDANKDGRISIQELKSLFSIKSAVNGSLAGEKILKDIMNEVDKNNDNEISYEEFNDALTVFLKNSVKWL